MSPPAQPRGGAPNAPRRLAWVRFLTGLWLFAVGVVLGLRSGLGVAPWDVFHDGIRQATPLSFRAATVLVGIVLVAAALGFGVRPGPCRTIGATAADSTVRRREADCQPQHARQRPHRHPVEAQECRPLGRGICGARVGRAASLEAARQPALVLLGPVAKWWSADPTVLLATRSRKGVGRAAASAVKVGFSVCEQTFELRRAVGAPRLCDGE